MAAMQRIATTETWAKHTTDDLEDREISAAGIHGFYPKWAHESGAGRGAEEAFQYRLPNHHSRFARDEARGSRRSEVPKELREERDEAGELSGLRPRVDGQRRRLTNDAVALLRLSSKEEVHF
jgi:hypothetical protein